MGLEIDFEQIILTSYTRKELRLLHALAEAMAFRHRRPPSWNGVQGRSL